MAKKKEGPSARQKYKAAKKEERKRTKKSQADRGAGPFDEYLSAFKVLTITPRDYFLKRAVPVAVAAIVFAVLGSVVAGILPLPFWTPYVIPLAIVGLSGFGIYVYPLTMLDRKKVEIENALPFFMTHMGVLSTSNMPRSEVIRILSERVEYGALAIELKRVYSLVVDWKMALPEACRFVSASTPSEIFGDFLERLAHAMETGQDMEQFMIGEQGVVMKEYATVYETAIYNVESWKDIYISSIMSGAFLAIFAIITPILTGADPQNLLMGTMGFIVFMEIMLTFVLKMRTPADKLWQDTGIQPKERTDLTQLTYMAGAAGVAIFIALALSPLPLTVAVAVGALPFILPARQAAALEEAVKRREDNFSAFVRSMGASLSSRGGSLREVLSSVKTHNYGPLTNIVERLYARLTWRIDDPKAWKYFSAESGSQLVDAFTDMFIEGVKAGGKADRVGGIISENVVRILNLRKSRYSTAGTFRGTLYGLSASMAFVLFLGVGILGTLGDLFALSGTVDADTSDLQAVDVNFDFNLPLVRDVVIMTMVTHGVLAGIMLKLADGGSIKAGIWMMIIMAWITAGLSTIAEWALPKVFTIT